MPRRFDMQPDGQEEIAANEEVKTEETEGLGGFFGGSFFFIIIIIIIFFLFCFCGKGFGYGYSLDE